MAERTAHPPMHYNSDALFDVKEAVELATARELLLQLPFHSQARDYSGNGPEVSPSSVRQLVMEFPGSTLSVLYDPKASNPRFDFMLKDRKGMPIYSDKIGDHAMCEDGTGAAKPSELLDIIEQIAALDINKARNQRTGDFGARARNDPKS